MSLNNLPALKLCNNPTDDCKVSLFFKEFDPYDYSAKSFSPKLSNKTRVCRVEKPKHVGYLYSACVCSFAPKTKFISFTFITEEKLSVIIYLV